jgi:hypothetical protein
MKKLLDGIFSSKGNPTNGLHAANRIQRNKKRTWDVLEFAKCRITINCIAHPEFMNAARHIYEKIGFKAM